MSTVTLHVGAFKTGTSFIQRVLSNNKDELANLGVLFPGERWGAQVRGVKGLLHSAGKGYQHWTALTDEIDAWTGPASIISMETLSLVDGETAKKAFQSLSNHRVRIVLTVRDIGRAIPAQWQESVQNKWTWTYSDYLAGAVQGKNRSKRAAKHFWTKQDWAKILRTWGTVVPAEDLIVVTVPPSGAPRGLLWERFCGATDLPPDRFAADVRVNESLGAASAEVMRHVTLCIDAGGVEERTIRAIKKKLSKEILPTHKSAEPSLVLPPEHHAWAMEKSEELVREIRLVAPKVIGDLDDLIPRFNEQKGPTTTDPSTVPADELLAAAAHGLVGLSETVGRRRRQTKP